ncbi:MAG: SH3 domain-containing protein, partial [Lentisphaeria bacterium]|nr:SH3 domain-containing protein [Lentisphaeria bacterium]
MTHTHSALSVLALALSLAFMAAIPALAADQPGTVTGNKLNVRAKPGRQWECIAKLQQGDRVQVVSNRDGWLEIRLPTSAKAWVAAKHLDRTGTVLADKLRVHAGPGIIFSTYSFVDQGAKLKCLGTPLGDWQKIEPPASATGWVAEAYVKSDPDDAETAVAKEAQPTEHTVMETVGVYAEPAERFDTVGAIPIDGEVEVFKVVGDWCQIRLPINCRAWIRANALDKEGRVSVDDASILAIPGIANTKLAPAGPGQKFERIGGPIDAWQMVVPPPQARGWISTASVRGLGTTSEARAKRLAAMQAEKAQAEAEE